MSVGWVLGAALGDRAGVDRADEADLLVGELVTACGGCPSRSAEGGVEELTAATDPLGRTSHFAYDAIGRPVLLTDPEGNTTSYTYDGFSNLLTVTDPLGRLTGFAYDPNGNLVEATDPRGHTTDYGYDQMDRLETITDPLGRTTTHSYDGNGNPTQTVSSGGHLSVHTYDELDRLIRTRYGVSGINFESETSYGYDAANRVTSIVDSVGGALSFGYDEFDRVVHEVSPLGQVDYTYDPADRRLTMSVAGAAQTSYGYNDAGQLTSLTRGTQNVSISYDPVGRREGVTLPGGAHQDYGYDAAGQLTSIMYSHAGTALGDLTYDYDLAGRPIHIDGTFARTEVPDALGPFTYDPANQRADHTYDDDGQLTFDGTSTYTWNARGQLAALSRPGLSASYGYDPIGRRNLLDTGTTATGYLYDGLNPIQELNGTTPTAELLTAGIDHTFTRTTAAGSLDLLTDPLGSTIAVAEPDGTLAGEYTYEPFGATTLTGDDDGNPHRYTGREDDATGLYYYRNRYYSPTEQRFISPDPLGLASGDTNPYTYVHNQPTLLTDPLGTKPQGSRQHQNDCLPNSFTPDTPVLMADGTTKAISQVQVGDQVMATDPETGETRPQQVTAVIQGTGTKDFTDVTVETPDGGQATITATDGHPFRVDHDGNPDTRDGTWTDAADLNPGQWLTTPDGTLTQVTQGYCVLVALVTASMRSWGRRLARLVARAMLDSPLPRW